MSRGVVYIGSRRWGTHPQRRTTYIDYRCGYAYLQLPKLLKINCSSLATRSMRYLNPYLKPDELDSLIIPTPPLERNGVKGLRGSIGGLASPLVPGGLDFPPMQFGGVRSHSSDDTS